MYVLLLRHWRAYWFLSNIFFILFIFYWLCLVSVKNNELVQILHSYLMFIHVKGVKMCTLECLLSESQYSFVCIVFFSPNTLLHLFGISAKWLEIILQSNSKFLYGVHWKLIQGFCCWTTCVLRRNLMSENVLFWSVSDPIMIPKFCQYSNVNSSPLVLWKFLNKKMW